MQVGAVNRYLFGMDGQYWEGSNGVASSRWRLCNEWVEIENRTAMVM
jgi:hypothetical protein